MKVLVVLTHSGFIRHLETVAAHLLEQGHEVKVISGRGRKVDAGVQLVLTGDRVDPHPEAARSHPRSRREWEGDVGSLRNR